VPIHPDEAHLHLEAGTASVQVQNQDVDNYGNILNALRDGPSDAAEVSYDIRWGDVIDRLTLHDTDNGFEGDFALTGSDITWSARQHEFRFVSDPMGTATSVFAIIGQERNGVFFS
jgi:hypothetical protein